MTRKIIGEERVYMVPNSQKKYIEDWLLSHEKGSSLLEFWKFLRQGLWYASSWIG